VGQLQVCMGIHEAGQDDTARIVSRRLTKAHDEFGGRANRQDVTILDSNGTAGDRRLSRVIEPGCGIEGDGRHGIRVPRIAELKSS